MCVHVCVHDNVRVCNAYTHSYARMHAFIYTTKGWPSSKFDKFLAVRLQFDSDHDKIWQACADRSGKGSYLNKLAPWMAWKGGLIGAILRSETAGASKALDLPKIHS